MMLHKKLHKKERAPEKPSKSCISLQFTGMRLLEKELLHGKHCLIVVVMFHHIESIAELHTPCSRIASLKLLPGHTL